MSSKSTRYAAPWAERLPDGDRIEYGPTAEGHARQLASYRLWAWRPPHRPSRRSVGAAADRVRAYMRPGGEHLRSDAPRRELEVYLYLYEHGRSEVWIARHLGVTRSSVRVYRRRLEERAAASAEEHARSCDEPIGDECSGCEQLREVGR